EQPGPARATTPPTARRPRPRSGPPHVAAGPADQLIRLRVRQAGRAEQVRGGRADLGDQHAAGEAETSTVRVGRLAYRLGGQLRRPGQRRAPGPLSAELV